MVSVEKGYLLINSPFITWWTVARVPIQLAAITCNMHRYYPTRVKLSIMAKRFLRCCVVFAATAHIKYILRQNRNVVVAQLSVRQMMYKMKNTFVALLGQPFITGYVHLPNKAATAQSVKAVLCEVRQLVVAQVSVNSNEVRNGYVL